MAYQGGPQQRREPSEYEEQVVSINRVTKKTKGGNKMGFAALAVVGDKKGKVGIGLGKAPDVAGAIRKGVILAKKRFITVPIVNGTIPFRIDIKLGAAKVMLKPAPKGSGIIAGGAVRSVVSAAGIENISSKVLGTSNQANNVYATIEALKQMAERHERMEQQKAARKGKK
jgi:small subunit ribosomal protein S5